MPKTWPQKLKDAMRGEYAVRTPDTVNVAAAVKDALERVLFQNDKQVADLLVDRVWADEHRTYIEVRYSEEVMS
jgi:Holliday junction resolvase RusA-like endonuclease